MMHALTPRSLDWADTAPVRAVGTRHIAAGTDDVWSVIADHERWPEWFTPVDSVVPGDPAEGVGGTRTVRVGPIEVEEEFLAWEPGRRFAFTLTHSSSRGLRSMVEDVRLTPDGPDATTVTYTQALEPLGGRFVRPVLAPLLRRALQDGLAGLEARVTG